MKYVHKVWIYYECVYCVLAAQPRSSDEFSLRGGALGDCLSDEITNLCTGLFRTAQ